MIFDIITIFPNLFDSYLNESIIFRARKRKLIDIRVHNLRDWTTDARKTVDDRPFGGGLGMVIKLEPVFKAVSSLIGSKFKTPNSRIASKNLKLDKIRKTKVILFTPRGKRFNQEMAYQLSEFDHLILICGRYEGVDERVAKYVSDEQISIGGYDLMGGELPAMILIEAVARLVPGVLGKEKLLEERITEKKGFIEYPQYTRPEVFSPPYLIRGDKSKLKRKVKWRVPKVLLSGHHKKIKEWRERHQKIIEK